MNYGKTLTPPSNMFRGTELKHFDINFSATSVNTGSYSYALTSQIASGTSATQRIGNVIFLKKIELDFFFGSGDNTNFIRCYLLACPNGQAPVPSFSTWYTPPDEDQYIVLKRKQLVTQNSATTVQLSNWMTTHNFPGKGMFVHYDTTIGTTEILNRIYITFVSDSSVIPDPTVTGCARVWFTDN